ncbi:MAG: FAD-dependent thymidylate synthase [Anaerolineae bacterium]|nr:FAD-dependent thymidylate synthase [Anaerolineae bacterium]
MKVTLLAYTQINPALEQLPADLVAGRGSPQEDIIEFAARVCYRSTARMGHSPEFIAARIREGHEDIIEHGQATYFIEGISRACSHQLVRHRIASFSQESQRYTELGENAEFVVPDAIANNPQARQVWDDLITRLEDAYREFRKLGVRKEDARFLLPNAATTSLVLSMNFRSLRHFFWLRCDRAAQWEIRDVATEMLRLIYPIAPIIFRDIVDKYGLHDVIGNGRERLAA